MNLILWVSVLISFLVTLLVLPLWIRKAGQIGLVWRDMNKNKERKVAGSGGLIVVLGFLFAVLYYIAVKTFYFSDMANFVEIFALLSSILVIGFIGFIDDIFGWVRGGLSAKLRVILIFIAAVPLIVINAGNSVVEIPMIGVVNIGIVYPLILIPLGIVGATTTYNFLAGYNGLEAGQGMIILTALSIVAFLTGSSWLSLIGACMVASLLAFLFFNKNPAEVFPGDILTYCIGALIAIMSILGNFERIAVFFFIPYIAETVLKLRGKLKKHSFGKPNKDGSLDMPYKKFYGLEHIAIWLLKKYKKSERVYEEEVVYAIWGFQLVIILLGFLIFRGHLF